MVGRNKVIQDASRLLSLAEAEKRSGISAAELHQMAGSGRIELCVEVPDDCDVYNADPTSIQVDNPAYLVPLSSFSKANPGLFDLPPFRTKVSVKVVALNPQACRNLSPETSGLPGVTAWQSLFSHGYALTEPGTKKPHGQYIKVFPESAKSVMPGDVQPAELWCLVIYPQGQQFFTDGKLFNSQGFQSPVTLVIHYNSLMVMESEVQKAVTLSKGIQPALLPSVDEIKLEPKAELEEPKPIAERSEPATADVVDTAPHESVIQLPASELVGAAPHKFIRVHDLMARLGCSRATVYDRLRLKSKRYDPTFPKQFHLDGMAVWNESEVNAWMAAQLAKRSGGQG